MEFFLKLLCSRSYAFLLLVLFMLLARSGFTRSVFIFCLSSVWLNQIGVAALSVKIEALEKQVSADSVDRALVCFVFFQSPCKRLKLSHHSVHPGSTIVEGCNWEGVVPGPAAPVPSPEAVSKLAVKASVRDLRFRNPVCFRAGNIHDFITR